MFALLCKDANMEKNVCKVCIVWIVWSLLSSDHVTSIPILKFADDGCWELKK